MQKHSKAVILVACAAGLAGILSQPAAATTRDQAKGYCSKNPRCEDIGYGMFRVTDANGKFTNVSCPKKGNCVIMHNGQKQLGANRAQDILTNTAGGTAPSNKGLGRAESLNTRSDLASGGLRSDGLKAGGATSGGLTATGSSINANTSRMGASSAGKLR